jgi:guanosine-3',5'-bis(diphosphate) 3'-pyrophosphohydrolase
MSQGELFGVSAVVSGKFLEALAYAADKHSTQRRKDAAATPYINHPILVARVLMREGGLSDESLLIAAILHDTVEDTDATVDEIRGKFGPEVASLVGEVTDDYRLPKTEHKRMQVEHAPHASVAARQLKIADKICNVRDLAHSAPWEWPASRLLEYLEWSEAVVAGCRDASPQLAAVFDAAVQETRAVINAR